ncbi:protein-methionine sulfoxide oxidase mical2b isoform X6 [Kryptolebias marmoratus]|uniref:protein-methionine sulfoxide oxidase mical2b isoform X6 n=1 Tax=Kryptolebias marmoratus TaxID=37003 RepID=UPI0018ACB1FD|nr:protein-methionine sulfoxide oxidase mical2b isoform X6 [Kryptolebias marmoratus]
MGETEDERTAQASQLFENFVQTSTCKGTLQAFSILCRQLHLDPLDHSNFYSSLKAAVSSWKVKALWTKLDKRAQQKVYNQNKACQGTRCLIIGGGPCGLRTAIELALLGCKVVVIEKRSTFSRNNVLHLWPYTIHDLKALGAKKFYGKFCAGAIDHISIRQLQLMLLKVSLILGVEIHVNVEFVKLVEPPEEQTDDSPGWRAEIRPSNHPVSDFEFDVVIGADGRRSTLDGFTRKEFRGKLAIAITANFVNRNTTAEAKVEEISGVAFIFNQKFFLELKEETGIDLENIVYYKDNTHYFVMTAKKQSLLDKGVIINDYIETERLLASDNVNQEALLSYAREAADFGTNYQLPSLDYAINHYGQPDVAMFDFTCMYASENAALIREKYGHQLLVALVGDSLLEPFWPMGTGCARGFLAAFDTVWMVRGWAQGKNSLEALAERESIYRLLPQTTPENISKNFEQYSIDPATRYPNLNSNCVRPHQVRHLFIDGQQDLSLGGKGGPTRRSVNLFRKESEVRPGRLLTWCQKQTQGYRGVDVTNLTSSWRNGLALCALIHRQRPDLIDFDSLNEEDVAGNNQLAFDVAEQEFSIQPVTTGKEMAANAEPDKLLMVLYLSKFLEAFRKSSLNIVCKEADENGEEYPSKTNQKLLNLPQPRKRIPRDEKKLEDDSVNKRRRKGSSYLTELSCHSTPPAGEDGELRENKVRSMATQLLAKFEENSSTAKIHTKSENPSSPSSSPPLSPSTTPPSSDEEEEKENPRFAKPKDTPPLPPPPPPPHPKWQCMGRKEFPAGLGGSDVCHFCSKRVYVMERLSAEGFFFHRECFRCHVCNCTLRLGGHGFDSQEAKFYCRMHYAQRQSSSHLGRVRRKTEDQSHVKPSPLDSGIFSSPGRVQPAGGAPSLQPEPLVKGQRLFPEDTELAVDALEASCTVEEGAAAKGQIQDATKGHCNTKQNNRWKRKIRTEREICSFQSSNAVRKQMSVGGDTFNTRAFPLILIKHFHLPPDKQRPETVPEVDCEETVSSENQTESKGISKTSTDTQNHSKESEKQAEPSAAEKPASDASSSRKRLILTQGEKEKLLNWDEETSVSHRQEQVRAEADKLQTNSIQNETASQSQTSAFQVLSNAFRRTFSGSANSSGPKTSVPMRPKRDGPRKRRPVSEGAFRAAESSTEGRRRTSTPGVRWASVSSDPWGAGQDLPSLLQQVSLKGRRESEGVFSDSIGSLSPKRVDLFSSIRIRKREVSEGEGTEQEVQKEIRTFLSNLRNKTSSQQNLEEPSSSDEEDESLTSSPKLCPEKLRRKQEKMAAQQEKREQLKRLHRAQAIQRQLEEVEEKQRDLEERGVKIEKIIRGEDSPETEERDEAQLYQAWFQLVLEKNRLARYESELMIFAQELALEDTQSRLQQDLRQRMAVEDSEKSASELQREQEILAEMMRTVEKRDMLVSVLEEQRLKEKAEDKDLESLILSKGYEFRWAHGGDSWGPEKLE